MTNIFKERKTVEQVEEGNELAPKFDENGLMPVVTTDAKTGDVLMLGYQNEEALKLTRQAKLTIGVEVENVFGIKERVAV
jgi:phosphoribosyl-AMP cyclohydrolase